MDIWFNGDRLYINLHPEEDIRGLGTSGEKAWHDELVLTFTSIPDIDEVVILVGGVREAWFSGHGIRFLDVYRVDDPRLVELRGR